MNRDDLLGPTPPGQEGLSYSDTNDSSGYKGVAIGGGVILALALSTGNTLYNSYSEDQASRPPERPSLESRLQDMVRSEQATLPLRVDELTTLTALDAAGRTVTMSYAISRDVPAADIAAARTDFYEGNRRNACASVEIGGLVREGATIAYRYVDPSGDVIDGAIRSCP